MKKSARTRVPKRHADRPRDNRPASVLAPPVEAGPREFRLQKFLASAGLGSRRQCEDLIRTGRVTVDGLPVENPGINVDPHKQVIEYDGERLKPERIKYFVLNKPQGVLCTNHDPAGRTRVIDLFAKERIRLFPVGRLDEESEGLLIVTNDGDLANQLAHPRYRIYRTYRVHVAGFPTNETLEKLRKGIFFREGKFQVISVHRAGKQGKSTMLDVVLGQGHNREVRRLFARVGHKVLALTRTAFGPVKLKTLKPGAYRELTVGELEQLREILTRNKQTPGRVGQSGGRPARPRKGPERSGDSETATTSETGPRSRKTGDKPTRSGKRGAAKSTPGGSEKRRIRRPQTGSLAAPPNDSATEVPCS